MKKLIVNLFLITAAFSISSCGYIHSHKRHHKHSNHIEEHFKKADKNNDGFISKKEHEQCSKKKYSEMDLNKDSKISLEELTQFKKSKWKK